MASIGKVLLFLLTALLLLAEPCWATKLTRNATVLGSSKISYDGVQGVRISRDPITNISSIFVNSDEIANTSNQIPKTPQEVFLGPNLYAYCYNNPLNYIDSLGLWTFSVGLHFSGQLGPLNINGGVGLTVDGQGHFGGYSVWGGGAGAGAGGDFGISFAGSNGDCIQDLGGAFGNTSASLGAGLGGSLDYFSGPGSQGSPCKAGDLQ